MPYKKKMKQKKKKKKKKKKKEKVMVTQAENRQSIIRIEGKIKLLAKDISVLRDNHIKHLSCRVGRMEKVMWTVCLIAITHLLYAVLH